MSELATQSPRGPDRSGRSTSLVWLIDGDDASLVAEEVRRLVSELVGAGADASLSVEDFRGEEVDLDAVSIATPGGLHHEIALAAAQAGKHILSEKPFTTSVALAKEMLVAAQSAGVAPAINHEFRMIPARQAFRDPVPELP